MFENYLKSSLRNIKNQKIYSMISIAGISLGMGIFIFMWFLYSFYISTDKFNKNSDRLYSVVQVLQSETGESNQTAITPAPLLKAMLAEFPEIEDGTRFFPSERIVIKFQDKKFYENSVLFVDPNFLDIFSFKLLKGNHQSVLSRPYSMVISESSALKYFGQTDPIGKTLTLNNNIDVTITGIVEDEPRNSSINYDFLVSMSTAEQLYEWVDKWSVSTQATYLLLPENFNAQSLETKFASFLNKYYADIPESPKQFYLLPLTDFIQHTIGIDTYQDKIFPVVIYLLLVSGIVLLLIGCFNFISLSTARNIVRAKEIGLRKIVGASRYSIILQFLIESLLITFLSLPPALVVFEVIQKYFLKYTGFPLFSFWEDPYKLIWIFSITFIVGLFAGSYPAFVVSSIKPVKTLKNLISKNKKTIRIRKILVISQFALSIILIVFAIIINLQFNHILMTDMGYNRENVLAVQIPEEKRSIINVLQNEFIKHSDIISVSASASLPAGWDTKGQVVPQGFTLHESKTVNTYAIDYNFTELFKIKTLQGRTFSRNREDESNFIVNETAIKQFQWEDPIGKEIKFNEKKGKVIGVVEDFLFKDVHFNIIPTILYLDRNNLNYILIKTASDKNIKETTDYLQKIWNTYIPDLPFELINHNHYFYNIYQGINTIAHLCGFVGMVGILFSCLGIFALATYTVERKFKEIGIRKVVGASDIEILKSLLKNFIKYVLWANVIGLPVSYLLSSNFLRWGFTYKINISLNIFIFVFLLSIVLSVLSVAWQAVRAIRANPVENLRYE